VESNTKKYKGLSWTVAHEEEEEEEENRDCNADWNLDSSH
jgi:hypothetical protein